MVLQPLTKLKEIPYILKDRKEKQNGALHPAFKVKNTNKARTGCYGLQPGIPEVKESSPYVH